MNAEIKIDAQTLLGKFLEKTPKNEGARGIGKSGVPPKNPTLIDLGLSKKESAEAKMLAKIVSISLNHSAVSAPGAGMLDFVGYGSTVRAYARKVA